MGHSNNPASKEVKMPYFPADMPTVQIIGTEEQRQAFFRWLERRDSFLINATIEKVLAHQDDPLSKHPEAAKASYWASLKVKGNGHPYSVRSFQAFVKGIGEKRLPNGLYSKAVARKWLFG